MRRRVVVGLVAAALIALAYWFGSASGRESCTVCLSYKGRGSCATASGSDAAAAVERARQKACARVAGDSVGICLQVQPGSVRCDST